MKKIITTSIAICVGIALMAQTSVDLKLNLEKNKTYRVKSSTEQSTTVTYGGAPQQIETKNTSIMSLKPVSMGNDFIVAEVRFDTITTNISMPKMEINSTKTGSLSSNNPSDIMDCIMNRFSKVVYNVKISSVGKVLEISNLKANSDIVTKGLDSLQGQLAMLKGRLVDMVSETAVKGMIEGVTTYLPGKKVNVGDKWDASFTMSGGGMGLNIASNYKLKKLTGNQAEVAAEVTIEPASTAPTEMNGMQMSYDVRGLGKSTLIVDSKTGWIIKVTSKTHVQGNMNIKAQGNDMQMPIESDGVTEVVALP